MVFITNPKISIAAFLGEIHSVIMFGSKYFKMDAMVLLNFVCSRCLVAILVVNLLFLLNFLCY